MAKSFGGFAQIFGGTLDSSLTEIRATPKSNYDFVPDQTELKQFLFNFASMFGTEIVPPKLSDNDFMEQYKNNVLLKLQNTVEKYNLLVTTKYEVPFINTCIQNLNKTFNLSLHELPEKVSDDEKKIVVNNLLKAILKIFSSFNENFKNNAAALALFTNEVLKNVSEMELFFDNAADFYEKSSSGETIMFNKSTLVNF